MFRIKDLICKWVWSDWPSLPYPVIVESSLGKPTSGDYNLVWRLGKLSCPTHLIGHDAGEGPGSWVLIIWDPRGQCVMKEHEFPHSCKIGYEPFVLRNKQSDVELSINLDHFS